MADAPLPELAANYGGFTLLGKGPLGETWRAQNLLSRQDVVLKIKPNSAAAHRYFAREVELMMQLRHAALQRLLEHKEIGDYFLLTYEYVPGEPLSERLKHDPPLTEQDTLTIMDRLLSALHVIHDAGFIYRDISPQNIILRKPDDPVLIDFNAIGQLTEQTKTERTTILGEVSGKPLYMSVEQLFGLTQTTGSDMWSVGALLYEMLVGRPFRDADDLQGVMKMATARIGPDVSAAPEPYQKLLSGLLATDVTIRPSLQDTQTALRTIKDNGYFDDLVQKNSPILQQTFGAKPSPVPANPAPVPAPSGDPFDIEAPAAPQPVSPSPDLAENDPWTLPAAPALAPAPQPHRQPPAASSSRGALLLITALAALTAVGGLVLWSPDLLGPDFTIPRDATFNAVAFVGVAIVIVVLGHLLSRYVHSRAADVRAHLPFQAVDLISSDDARDQLSRTICVEIDAYRAAANNSDDILTITMVAAAQEYRDAENFDDRFKALQMLADLNTKVSNRLKPWWLDYEKLVARGISLISLLAGAVALFKAAQTLI